MDRREITELATSKLKGIPGLDFAQANVTVDADFGRIIVAPYEQPPVKDIDGLAQGAVIAALRIEHATTGASLGDGMYRLKVFNDRGTWVGQLLAGEEGNNVAFTTTRVEVIPLAEPLAHPMVVAFSYGWAAVIAAFVAGMAVGFLIASLL